MQTLHFQQCTWEKTNRISEINTVKIILNWSLIKATKRTAKLNVNKCIHLHWAHEEGN